MMPDRWQNRNLAHSLLERRFFVNHWGSRPESKGVPEATYCARAVLTTGALRLFAICSLSFLVSYSGMPLHRVCAVSDLPPGGVKRIDHPAIAVFNVEGTLFGISDICTHAEASLSEGTVDGDIVECPLHGAAFDLRTGEALTPPAVEPVQTFPVVTQGNDIYVEVK
jgi:3-phenylpropionate/trans-cinnamate dioxygenase ferredoxin subunit